MKNQTKQGRKITKAADGGKRKRKRRRDEEKKKKKSKTADQMHNSTPGYLYARVYPAVGYLSFPRVEENVIHGSKDS